MWTHGMSWRLIAALMVIGTVHSCFKQEWAKCSYLASALVLSIIIGAAPLYAGIVEQFMPLYGGIWHDPVALYSMRGYGEWWHVPWIFMELILIGAGIHAMWGRLKYFSSVVVIFLLLLPYEFLTYGGTDWYRSVAPLLLIIGLLGSIHIADAGWLHRDRYSRIINNNLIWSLMLVMAFSEALFVGCPTPSFTVRSPPMADDEHIAHLVPPGARIAIDRSRSERVPWGNQWEAQALHSYETVDGLQFRFASLALSTYNNAASSIFESSYIGMPGIRNYQTPRESLSILRDVFGVQMVFMRKEWYSHRSSIDGYVIKKSDAFDYIQLDGHLGITGVDEPIIDESTTILSWWGSAKAHWLDEPTKPVCSKLTLSGEISKHIPRPFVATRKPSIRVDAAGIELMDVIPGSWYRIPYAYSRMFTSDNSVFGEDQWGLMVVQPRSDQVRIAFDPLAVNAISISLILSTLGFLLSLVAAVITLLWRGRTR
jgi:hypothetical protein